MLAPVLVTAALTGCIGSEEDPEQPNGFKLFVAASGEGPATMDIDSIRVDLNGSAQAEFLDVQAGNVDLGDLAANDRALLVASHGELSGTAKSARLSLSWLDLGSENLSATSLELPVSFTVGPEVEATVTLDLDETRSQGTPVAENLVVERSGTRLEAYTARQLNGTDRTEIPPLPTPTITTTADGGNRTGPSFLVNEQINFTYGLSEPTDATIRNVFWAFGDDSTGTGELAQHAYRSPGFYRVTVIVEGEHGQQATANTTLEAYIVRESEGNVHGSGGLGAIDTRDVKDHTVEIPKSFTSLSFRLEQGPSGGACEDEQTGECAPSNVHVELYNPSDELLGRNTTDAAVKWINITGLMSGGDWTVRVKGDTGVAIGYNFQLEAHYLGLCEDAGGLPGYDCPPAPEPLQQDGGLGLPSP